jgi:hypothetical protein
MTLRQSRNRASRAMTLALRFIVFLDFRLPGCVTVVKSTTVTERHAGPDPESSSFLLSTLLDAGRRSRL